MIKKILSALCFGLIVALVAPVQADITFGIDATPSFVSSGTSGTLVFYVTATGADQSKQTGGAQVGYTPTAFGGASLGDLTLGNAMTPTGVFTSLTTSTVGSSYGITASGGPFTIGSRLDLFSVAYSVTGGSTGGFNFNIEPLDIGGGSLINPVLFDPSGADLGATYAGNEGTITYGVPEPTSLGFLMGAAGLAALRRRRKSA